MFCTKCGKELADNAKFCNACGTPNALAAAAPAPVAPVAQEPAAPVVETPVAAPVVEAPVAAPVVEAPVAAPVAAPAAPKAAPVAAPAAPAAPKKKSKKGLVIFLCILIPLLIAGGVFAWYTIDKNNKTEMLEEANEAIEEGEYEDAAELLGKLGDFEGADQLLAQLNAYIAAQDALLEGNYEQALELLEQAGDFEDAEDILDDLEDKLRDYDKAVKALEKHDFAKAEELLQKLKSFKDSKKLLASIPFEKAMLLMESALGDNYQEGLALLESEGYYTGYEEAQARRWMLEEAAGRFANMLEYKYGDAFARRNECWYHLGRLYAEDNSLSSAEYYLQQLQENNGGELAAELEAYIDTFYADSKFLDMLKAALEERMKLEKGENVNYADLLLFEQKMIEQLQNMKWRDSDLGYTFSGYCNAVWEEQSALSSDGEIENLVPWYYGQFLRCGYLENLNKDYGFLNDAQELKDHYRVGQSKLFYAYYKIEKNLQDYLGEGNSVYYDSDSGRYYVYLYNGSGYEYTVQTFFDFYDEQGDLVASFEGEIVEVPLYDSVDIWLTIPDENVLWNTWTLTWTYSDIYENGEKID